MPARSQLANWRGVRWRILSKSARLYKTLTTSRAGSWVKVPTQGYTLCHYAQVATQKATVKACGTLWGTWIIYMQRKWCSRASPPKQPRAAVSPWILLDRDGGLVLLVSALEVGDLVIAFEVPDAGGNFID